MVAVLVKKVIEYMDCHKISSDPLSYSSIAIIVLKLKVHVLACTLNRRYCYTVFQVNVDCECSNDSCLPNHI